MQISDLKNRFGTQRVPLGHIPAAEYRKVIVGLIFLRYISSAFEKRYQQLVDEGDGFEDDKDAYAEGQHLLRTGGRSLEQDCFCGAYPEIGTVIDEAMRAIEKENTTLKMYFLKTMPALI